jgi:hypothetical protein
VPQPDSRLIQYLVATGKVAAIGLGGSQASGYASGGSDYDVYILTTSRIEPAVRRQIAGSLADDPNEVEVDIPYWGDEDAYRIGGTWYDLAYFDADWFFGEISSVVHGHTARQGYTTSFVHTLANMQPLYDPSGILTAWKAQLQHYPEPLAQSIIATNYPVACTIHSSYRNQADRAVQLGDAVAVNHRVAAFLACVFDITFAVLRMWHPGEKRQLQYLERYRDALPTGFADHITAVVHSTTPDRLHDLIPAIDHVVTDVTAMVTTTA